MNNKRKTKLAVGIVLLLLLFTCLAVVLLQSKGKISYVNAESADEIFYFSQTSDSECSVRLKDKNAVKAIIPETMEIGGKEYAVTSITANGFASAENLKKVRIPDTVKTIGQSAFLNCTALESLTLPAVESIGANAFALTNLEYIIIPETVNIVAPTILRGCSTQVYVRAELAEGASTPNGRWASNWNGANEIQNVEYGSKFQPNIEYKEVWASDLTRSYSLYATDSSDFLVGYNVDEYQAFCNKQTEGDVLYIPATYNGRKVMGIENNAFTGNSISNIVIGYSGDEINIKTDAFSYFKGKSIIFNREVTFEDKDWFTGESVTSTNVFANSKAEIIVLPNSITEIGDYAFMGCSELTDIQFIAPSEIGENAEKEQANNLKSTNTADFSKSNLTTIGSYAFSDTKNISKITIPNTVTTVGSNILSGWKTENNQKAYIRFKDAASLPAGWNSQWKNGCDEAVIEYASESDSGEIKTYNISYEYNYKDPNIINKNPTSISRIQTITLQNAELLGYTFIAWYDNGSYFGETKTTIGPLESDITLYGAFRENKYTIRYNSNKPENASGQVTGIVSDSTKIPYTQSIRLNANDYILEGWHFVEWNTKQDGSGISYKDGEVVSKLTAKDDDVVTLYAQWTSRNYSVVYDKNRPEYASSFVEGETENSEHTSEYQNLTKNGYTLLGWHFVEWNTRPDGRGIGYADCESVIDLAKNGEEEITLYAQWDPNTYYIVYLRNEPVSGATFSGSMTTTILKYDEYYNLTKNDFSAISYSFDNWLSSDNQEYEDQERIYNLTTEDEYTFYFYAQWTAKSINECCNNGCYEIAASSQLEDLDTYGVNDWTFLLMTDLEVDDWSGISEFNGTLNGNGHVIKYKTSAVRYGKNYGLICINNGTIRNLKIQPTILNVLDKPNSNDRAIWFAVGGAVGVNYGTIEKVDVLKTIANPYMNLNGNCAVDIYSYFSTWAHIGGIVGENYSIINSCNNYASLGGGCDMAGIVCLSYEGAQILNCTNNGNIYFNCSSTANSAMGGIASVVRDSGQVKNCVNYATITWAARINAAQTIYPYMGRLAGRVCESVISENNRAYGSVKIVDDVKIQLYWEQTKNIQDSEVGEIFSVPSTSGGSSGGGCVASGTLVTLNNGTQLPVESLTGNEYLLVWNLYTGTFDVAPILFIDNDTAQIYEVINLYFSDGTEVEVISEHAFWDFDLNEYVFLRDDAAKYIGHWFNKQTQINSEFTYTKVQLIDVIISEKYTTAWSPVTYGHLCYYVNGMLSMPGATEGLINIFNVNAETMRYDETAFASDIETYGLFTYEEFNECLPVSQEVFEAFGGQYLKVSMGKGLIDFETLASLLDRYSSFLQAE